MKKIIVVTATLALLNIMSIAHAQYAGYRFLDSYSVPSNDTYVSTSFVPITGGNYLLEASGTWSWDVRTDPDKMADARWLSIDNWTTHYDDHYDVSNGGTNPIGLYVSGYNDSIWGEYSPSHVYTAVIIGNGSAVTFHILDEFVANNHKVYGDNIGGLTVRVFESIPEPSSILALLCGIGGMGLMIRRPKTKLKDRCLCSQQS